jgi:hypothetical protein
LAAFCVPGCLRFTKLPSLFIIARPLRSGGNHHLLNQYFDLLMISNRVWRQILKFEAMRFCCFPLAQADVWISLRTCMDEFRKAL